MQSKLLKAFTLLISMQIVSLSRLYINGSDIITGKNLIEFYVPSYTVAVAAARPAVKYFDKKYISLLRSSIVKSSHVPGVPRGIPPYNWVKFYDIDGNAYGLFIYKTITFCNPDTMTDIKLFDYMPVEAIRYRFGGEHVRPEEYHMSRTMIGQPLSIHSLATDAIELYSINVVFSNFTHLPGPHSDIRVISFAQKCRYFDSSKYFRNAKYVFAGAVNTHDWHEKQFMAVLDDKFNILMSKILTDPGSPAMRPQKNWLPFWDGCKLMFSKRFAPHHVVSEFTEWRAKEQEVAMKDTVRSLSPATVPGEDMVRGSAPVIRHPMLESQYGIGCVHVRGRHKVYRHSLYVMEMSYPYSILSYSPLFTFKPYRDIEFVMSINVVRRDGSLELTHGSMDCEPKLAIFPIDKLKSYFGEFFKFTM